FGMLPETDEHRTACVAGIIARRTHQHHFSVDNLRLAGHPVQILDGRLRLRGHRRASSLYYTGGSTWKRLPRASSTACVSGGGGAVNVRRSPVRGWSNER